MSNKKFIDTKKSHLFYNSCKMLIISSLNMDLTQKEKHISTLYDNMAEVITLSILFDDKKYSLAQDSKDWRKCVPTS